MTVEILVAVAGILAVPWAFWVSKALWDIKTLVTGLHERTVSNTRRIEDLEALLPRHIPRG